MRLTAKIEKRVSRCFLGLSKVFVSMFGLHRLTRGRRCRRHASVIIFPQRYDFSCTASVLQSVVHSATGKTISHDHAVALTRCCPNGAQLSDVATAATNLYGAGSRTLKNLRAARFALARGRVVVSCDNRTYGEPHAILLVGVTPKGVYVVDSNRSDVCWKKDQWCRKSADEYIEVIPPEIHQNERGKERSPRRGDSLNPIRFRGK